VVVRLLVVSDTHLAAGHDAADDNWQAVLASVGTGDPSLVLHLGDLSLDGANSPDQLKYARSELERLEVPWRAVPGNHDLGDNPVPGEAGSEKLANDDRRQAWLDTVGPDWWRLDIEDWTLLAVNVQLFGTNLVAEAAQWEWFENELADVGSEQALALLVHKPLFGTVEEPAESPPGCRYIPTGPRGRLLALMEDRPPKLILSGHVHQHRILDVGGARHVWTPTTWAVAPDDKQPRLGVKRCGYIYVALDGRHLSSVEFVEPPGTTQQVIGRTIENPYECEVAESP
jgi:3',5'-cyclic AMP phosphodiesterase CpdA